MRPVCKRRKAPLHPGDGMKRGQALHGIGGRLRLGEGQDAGSADAGDLGEDANRRDIGALRWATLSAGPATMW